MAPGRKQGRGCWTCRLRRKRCNSVRPVCGSCQSLDITCYSGDARPTWMDGGAGQKRMSELIKKTIKQNASARREKRLLTHGDRGIVIAPETNHTSYTNDIVHLTSSAVTGAGDSVAASTPPASSVASTLSANSTRLTTLRSFVDQSEDSQSSFTTPSSVSNPITLLNGSSPGRSWPADPAVPIPMQLGSIMIYLDYVFPFLFPFYQPPLIETGRQWLLGLLCQNELSLHVAASLSAHFFSLIPQNAGLEMHDDCKALVWEKLTEQMDLAVKSIQNTVSAVRSRGPQAPLLDKARIMEEITQLLIVEVTIQREVNWQIHLTPALVLFDEIFQSHGIDHSGPNLAVLLSALPVSFPVAPPSHKPLPNTADQSALSFFVSLLLFIDIIASTSLGAPPVLQPYHASLLSSSHKGNSGIRLETIVGCQNWPLVAIGQISTLVTWKRSALREGTFSTVALDSLAAPISRALDDNLAHTTSSHPPPHPDLQAYYSQHPPSPDVTHIWAHAAHLYLSTVLPVAQPSSAVRSHISAILDLLPAAPAQLRSLAWPVCVAGCLAPADLRHRFERLADGMGALREFGTLAAALRIVRAAWKDIDREGWDIADALGGLGTPALLV